MSNRFKIVLSLLALLVCCYLVLLLLAIRQDSIDIKTNNITTEVAREPSLDERIEFYVNNTEELEDEPVVNHNIYKQVGHLRVHDTLIDYPVMYSDDLLFYAEHDKDGNVDSKGAIFLDARITDMGNSVLLIHGLTNSDGTMFTQLLSYTDDSWASKHTMLTLKSSQTEKNYHLFAVVNSEADEGVIQLECTDNTTRRFLYDSLVEKSIANFSYEFKEDKQFVVLNTVDHQGKHILVCFMEE